MKEGENPANEFMFFETLTVIWKRKWLIIIPSLLCAVLAGVLSFLMPPVWGVDMLLTPCQFIVQTERGNYAATPVVEPKQVAALVNQKSFDSLIAKELNLKVESFPRINAENLKDTKLIKISVKDYDLDRAKSILSALFGHLKNELDKEANVQFKEIDTQIAFLKNQISYQELVIRDSLNRIKLLEIDIQKTQNDIRSWELKMTISEERAKSLLEEIKTAKTRMGDFAPRQDKDFAGTKEGTESISRLLYANETQNTLAYYDVLDEKLSMEKIAQENARLAIKEGNESIRQLSIYMDESRNDIDKVKLEIENIKTQVAFLAEKKASGNMTQLLKEPTASLSPVSPKKAKNILIVGILGLLIFSIVAFFLEHLEKRRK